MIQRGKTDFGCALLRFDAHVALGKPVPKGETIEVTMQKWENRGDVRRRKSFSGRIESC